MSGECSDPHEPKRIGLVFPSSRYESTCLPLLPNQAKIPRYTLVTYPDGGMLTNCHDLSRYLQAMMKGYFKGEGILNADSYQNMMSIQFTDDDHKSGVFWDINKSNRIGHTGADPGVFFHQSV